MLKFLLSLLLFKLLTQTLTLILKIFIMAQIKIRVYHKKSALGTSTPLTPQS